MPVLLYFINIFVILWGQMPALADLQSGAENPKGWLKLSPRTCQLGTFLYNPQLLCTTMIYTAVLSSGKTSLFI